MDQPTGVGATGAYAYKNVFVQIGKVFVQIVKYICLGCKMY